MTTDNSSAVAIKILPFLKQVKRITLLIIPSLMPKAESFTA
jgi:hypothetical protein